MTRALVALAAALALAAVGCGDDTSGDNNPGTDGPSPDADVDAPPEATFTSFVIDLVMNQTAGNTDPRPYLDFADLDDPDLDNPAAYDSLFQ